MDTVQARLHRYGFGIVMAPSAMSSSYVHHQHPVLLAGLPPSSSTPRLLGGVASIIINTPSSGRGCLHHHCHGTRCHEFFIPPSSRPRFRSGVISICLHHQDPVLWAGSTAPPAHRGRGDLILLSTPLRGVSNPTSLHQQDPVL